MKLKFVLFSLTLTTIILLFLPSCNDEVDLVDTDAHSPEIAMNEKMEKLHYEKSGTTLAERFAPQIALHSCERLFPSDPVWYINRVKMEFTRKGSEQLIANPVSINIIANRAYYEGPWNCRKHAENSGAGYHSNFYLQIPNDGNEQNTRRGNPNTNELRILVNIHERIGNSDIKEIQYWIFYPFNALCSLSVWCGNSNTECGLDGAHEGDWEHITVNYSVSRDKAVGVYMSRHEGEGQTYSPSQILWLSEHPIVYSALGSHASYPTAGTHNGPWPLPSDHTNYGILIDTWTLNNYVIDDCEDFGCLNSPSAPNWLKYSGFWGELGATFANPIPGNGPVWPGLRA